MSEEPVASPAGRSDTIGVAGSRIRLVVGKETDFEQVRCSDCAALLFRRLKKSKERGAIEIKCRRCGRINYC